MKTISLQNEKGPIQVLVATDGAVFVDLASVARELALDADKMAASVVNIGSDPTQAETIMKTTTRLRELAAEKDTLAREKTAAEEALATVNAEKVRMGKSLSKETATNILLKEEQVKDLLAQVSRGYTRGLGNRTVPFSQQELDQMRLRIAEIEENIEMLQEQGGAKNTQQYAELATQGVLHKGRLAVVNKELAIVQLKIEATEKAKETAGDLPDLYAIGHAFFNHKA